MKDEIQETLEFVVKAHSNQKRQFSGLPFIVHPIQVVKQIEIWGIRDPVMWKAALCHDVIEDCPMVSLQDLLNVIGSRALAIVDELTFTYNPALKEDQGTQKAQYMSSFSNKSIEALIIKLSDRICNTIEYSESDLAGARRYWNKAGSLLQAFYDRINAIANTFSYNTIRGVVSDLDKVRKELKTTITE